MLEYDFKAARDMCKKLGLNTNQTKGVDKNYIVAIVYRSQFYDMFEDEEVTEVPMSLISKINDEAVLFKSLLVFKHDGEDELNSKLRELFIERNGYLNRRTVLTHEMNDYVEGTGIRYSAIFDELDAACKSGTDKRYIHFLKLFGSMLEMSKKDEEMYCVKGKFEEIEYLFPDYIERLKKNTFKKNDEFHDAISKINAIQDKINELLARLKNISQKYDNYVIFLPNGKHIKILNM